MSSYLTSNFDNERKLFSLACYSNILFSRVQTDGVMIRFKMIKGFVNVDLSSSIELQAFTSES